MKAAIAVACIPTFPSKVIDVYMAKCPVYEYFFGSYSDLLIQPIVNFGLLFEVSNEDCRFESAPIS